ncbi:MAG: hypothetical protein GTO45_09185 [Candidatus Aminicenantes bacterium]|nr:hypothetical protein [Candidatus Aminicenantes bacterium]NIM79007.1 hypothetical protein [Candidatus Aminicenantes bacterium]NIN18265.1 hypothetical protein [Candidatus Aminicenantes bacterium]NIN42162.1 hypothetical protein [Candidatus Aminicenantes bacterium]NIN84918.1 hypothetical protein [Candidatus Aminicenantes bacterium]
MIKTTDNVFKGKWVIQYSPAEFDYKYILEVLADIRDRLEADKARTPYKRVIFNKNFTDNHFSLESANSLSEFPAPEILVKFKNVKKINNVLLAYPVLLSDKRWETIHLTAASVFMGSSLDNAGFNVTVKKLILPVTNIDSQLRHYDLIGLTLFEDLFIHTKEFLSHLREVYNGFIAAGGPMITLTPLESAYHLPEINLLVRGEAEFVLPELIDAINTNNVSRMLEFKGFLFQVPGMIIISDFNEINRPENFAGFRFNLDFLEKDHVKEGLEINVSRGCKRGCIFCSAVQGRGLRKLPGPQLQDLLNRFSDRLDSFVVRPPAAGRARTVNINDDDILQDLDYAGEVFQLIKRCGFRLWGIQTSINSFFDSNGELNRKALEIIADKSLYVDDNPLVWSGTDAFLKKRGKKLGKIIPGEQQMIQMVEELEKRQIRNYHYWISSDYRSGWEEFTQEFMFIYQLQDRFNYFGLIAHSPFLVPYSTTPLYRLLTGSDQLKNQIKYKKILESGKEMFTFPLVERVETPYIHLNRLLNNEKLSNRRGFFDYLKQKDYVNAFITLYNFLKQERIDAESLINSEEAKPLKQVENKVETFISKLLTNEE